MKNGAEAFRKKSRPSERLIEGLLFLSAILSVVITVGIVGVLLFESFPFFKFVGLSHFLFDREWTPLFNDPQYGIMALASGTLVTTAVALAFAVPVGLVVAIYLSEYATNRTREVLKPMLELLSAVPTVVYGYFALMVMTPILQKFIPELPGYNMLSAGLVMGVMVVPYISSLSEDALRSVPQALREGSYAMGASRVQTALKVVLPASLSGVTAATILALARCVGETMIVTIAAGLQPTLTLNPLSAAETLTAYIVQVSLGDMPHGSIAYQSIFAVGLSLALITLFFNLMGHLLKKRMREAY